MQYNIFYLFTILHPEEGARLLCEGRVLNLLDVLFVGEKRRTAELRGFTGINGTFTSCSIFQND